jgi:L-iditol 2-dehydrogenase
MSEFRSAEVLIRVKSAGICGSDIASYEGYSTEGIYPFTPGHEWSGEIVDVGSSVESLEKGDRVVADTVEGCGTFDICRSSLNPALSRSPREFGFQQKYPGAFSEFVVRKETSLHKLPSSISYEEGALVEPLTVAYNAVWNVGNGVKPTDDVVIFGAGTIGLQSLICVKSAGARAFSVDPVTKRQELASKFDADYVINPMQVDPTEKILALTAGHGVDLAIEASGTVDASSRLADVVDRSGSIVLIGNSYGKKIQIELGKAISKGLTIQGSVGSPGTFPAAIHLMAQKGFNFSLMISHRFPLDKIDEALQVASSREGIKVMIVA